MPTIRALTDYERERIVPMDVDMKSRWLAALRSGAYKQSTKWLRSSTGYCCLGVLCEVSGCQWEEGTDYYSVAVASERKTDRAALVLPPTTEIKCGVNRYAQRFLAESNDDEVPFTDIADWIEIHL